ncbi:MAG: GGDEF domain-containing protein, partial [Chloroflexota bacterium]|nr:GGDEF domain-containing protein [Chloroflexota bacterium]
MISNGEFYRKLLDHVYDGVYFVDRNRKITFWNKGAEQLTGYTSERVIGSSCSDNLLNHMNEEGTVLCKAGCPLAKTIADGQPRQAQVYLKHADGHRVPVLVRVLPFLDEMGNVVGGVETFSDNSALVTTLSQVNELQRTVARDLLTGVGNRQYIEMKLQSCLSEFKMQLLPFGLLFIDIDHFKRVNDTYGHNTGDKVLKMVANTLSCNVRATDFLGRWGGEEFVALIPNLRENHLANIANKLRHLVAGSQLQVDQHEVRVTISIGATLAQGEDTAETLVGRADQLLYQSKSSGRNCVSFA